MLFTLLVADLGVIPDRACDLGIARGAPGKELAHPVAGIGGERRRRGEGKAEANCGFFHRGIRGR